MDRLVQQRVLSWVRSIHFWRWKRITIALALLLILQENPFQRPSLALAYSCTSGHCYAVDNWAGGVTGAATDITVRGLGAPDNGQGFITNELWVFQYPGTYWVEEGITVGPSQGHPCTADCYFWADSRPGSSYYEHWLESVPQTDYGKSTTFSISTGYAGENTWNVDLQGYNGSFTELSQNNSMSPNYIQIGGELEGSSGGYALEAHYTNNYWSNDYNTFNYQTGPGNQGTVDGSANGAPWNEAGWANSPYPGNNGGDWVTACGC